MCETKPGLRCAADTRHAAVNTAETYHTAYGANAPAINPLGLAGGTATATLDRPKPVDRYNSESSAARFAKLRTAHGVPDGAPLPPPPSLSKEEVTKRVALAKAVQSAANAALTTAVHSNIAVFALGLPVTYPMKEGHNAVARHNLHSAAKAVGDDLASSEDAAARLQSLTRDDERTAAAHYDLCKLGYQATQARIDDFPAEAPALRGELAAARALMDDSARRLEQARQDRQSSEALISKLHDQQDEAKRSFLYEGVLNPKLV